MITIPQPFGGLVIPRSRVQIPPFDISYVSSNTASSVTNTTFTDQPIGDPSPARLIVVEVARMGIGGISSVTVGGISASEIVVNTGQNHELALWVAKVPSGTTADIAISLSSAAAALIINVLRVVGQSSDTPYDTGVSSGGNDSNRSVAIDAPAGGGVIVGASGTDANHSYTNATKLHEERHFSNDRYVSCGSYITVGSTQTNRSISVNSCRCIVAASWA